MSGHLLHQREGRLRTTSGITLLEIMVVVAIVGALMAGATVGLRTVAKSDLRAAAGKLASSMRYLHDRARVGGRNYRLVMDLDEGVYWAEETEDRFYLPRDDEEAERDREADEEEREEREEREEDQQEEDPEALEIGLDEEDLFAEDGPWKRRRPRFDAYRDANVKPIQLKGTRIASVTTATRGETLTEGRAYVHFFSQGIAEHAVVMVQNEGGSIYSLINHPLRSRVRVVPREVDPERELEPIGGAR